MLSQAVYWATRTGENDGWFYKTQADWEAETGLSRYEQESARKALKERGILSEELRGLPAKLWFRINPEELVAHLQPSLRPNPILGCGQTPNKYGEEPHPSNGTENTTENTNKRGSARARKEAPKQEILTLRIEDAFPVELATTEFSAAWENWLAYLTAKRKKPTAQTVKLQIAKLKVWGSARAIIAIGKSIENGWIGLFEPDQPKGRAQQARRAATEHCLTTIEQPKAWNPLTDPDPE